MTSGSIFFASQWAAALSRMAERFFRQLAKRGALAWYMEMVIAFILSRRGGNSMSKFKIAPHFRLQEWVAEEKGYFQAEGLDYEFRDSWGPGDVGKTHQVKDKFGAYQTFDKGRDEGVSCACHWTVNVAAANGKGKLYAD